MLLARALAKGLGQASSPIGAHLFPEDVVGPDAFSTGSIVRFGALPPSRANLAAIRAGYISVTPLHLDLTHRAMQEKLDALFAR